MTTPAGTGPRTAAIWARVSTEEQHTENQLHVLRQWAADRGFTVTAEFITEDSAWSRNGGKGEEFDRQREALIRGAHLGQYKVVLIWALDRLSRRGYRDLDSLMGKLAADNCEVLSHQEEWITNTGPFGELIRHMLALSSEQESSRRSERIKLGMARVQREIDADLAAGKTPTKRIGGRKPGSKDKKSRRREGYRRPRTPVPEWLEQAQAMYDELNADGRPAHRIQDIADRCGSNPKSVWRRLSKNGPGGKARAQRLTAPWQVKPRPPAPTPPWVAAAQAMYDEVGEDGGPVHLVPDIAAHAGVSITSLYRRLDRDGPGSKARVGMWSGGRRPGSKDRGPRRTEGYRQPKAPAPEWAAQAQAMYDELDPEGRPVHHVLDIAGQVGTNAKSLYRRLDRDGPGGKARAQGLTAPWKVQDS
jgi:DNA invertase Pin-like site-specific DNA recombinase